MSTNETIRESMGPGLRARLFRSAGREKWVLADQLLVSGMNFFTGILLVRLIGLQQYGVFVILYAIIMYANTVQGTLIFSPMFSIVPQCSDAGERKQLLGGFFSLQLLAGIFFGVAVLCFGLIGDHLKPAWLLKQSLAALVLTTFSFQVQDWLRRYFFVEERGRAAFLNDVISYVGQVVGFVVLNKFGLLTVPATMYVIGGTSLLAFLVGLPFVHLRLRWSDTVAAARKIWRFSRDLFLAGQLQWLGSQGVLLIAAAMMGTRVAGGVRAAQNIVGPINVCFQAMENFLPMRAAQRYRDGGLRALIAYLRKTTIVGSAGLMVIFVFIAIFSRSLLMLAYGKQAAAYSLVLIWQLVYFLFGYSWRQIICFYRSIKSTGHLIPANMMACIATVASAPILISRFHASGVMVALTIGELVSIGYLMAKLKSASARKALEVANETA